MKKRFLISSLLALSIIGCSTPMINTSQDFSDLEKEYKSFSTNALSDVYVKRMFGKYLSPVNSVQLTRQLEFSRYLKSQNDTSYETSLKSMFSQTPVLYDQMTAIGTISNKMSTESATFGTFVNGLSPYPGVPVATSATNITQTSFTANWASVANATGYKLTVDNGTPIDVGAVTTYNLTGLTAGSNHTYYVQAINSGVTGSGSLIIPVTLIISTSCKGLKNSKGINTNGIYYVDQDNNSSTPAIRVYCDMTTSGGGWTLVVAQYENDPVINWNEGIQEDYDPSLITKKGFALKTEELPADRTQTGFGKDLNPTGIDYVNFVYNTSNVPSTYVIGLKNTSNSYYIFRSTSGCHYGYDPQNTYVTGYPEYNNALTFDINGTGYGFTWAFGPLRSPSSSRGYSYGGIDLDSSSQIYAWTVWVR